MLQKIWDFLNHVAPKPATNEESKPDRSRARNYFVQRFEPEHNREVPPGRICMHESDGRLTASVNASCQASTFATSVALDVSFFLSPLK